MFSNERKTCMNTKILVMLVAALAVGPAMAEVVFHEDFDNGDLAGWTDTAGNCWANIDGKAVFPQNVISGGDCSLYTTFDNVQPENGAFKFTGEFMFLDNDGALSNGFKVYLLDAAGQNGYVIRRSYKLDDANNAPLSLSSLSNGTETVIMTLNPIVYAANGTWEITRDEEGLLTVRMGGTEQFDLFTLTDTTHNNFGRVELKITNGASSRGYGYSFDNIMFEVVPEPATMILTIMGGAFMLKRRK